MTASAVRAASANATVPFALQTRINAIRGSTDSSEIKAIDFPGYEGYALVGFLLNLECNRAANANVPSNTVVADILEYIQIHKRLSENDFDRIATFPADRFPSLVTMLCEQSPFAMQGYFGHQWFVDDQMANTNAAKTDRAQYVLPGSFGLGRTRMTVKLHSLSDVFGTDVSTTNFNMRVTPMYVHRSRILGETVTRYFAQYLSSTQKLEDAGPSTTFGIAGKSRLSSIVAAWAQGDLQMESNLLDDLEDNFSWRIHDHVPEGSSWSGGIAGLDDPTINANSHIAMSSIPGAQVEASVDFKSSQEALALHIGRSVRS